MARVPPVSAPPGSKYITPEGARRLREELERLWREERPSVCRAVTAAAAQGDRSENAEYTYGKRRLREIDRREPRLRPPVDGRVVVGGRAGAPERVVFACCEVLRAEAGSRPR